MDETAANTMSNVAPFMVPSSSGPRHCVVSAGTAGSNPAGTVALREPTIKIALGLRAQRISVSSQFLSAMRHEKQEAQQMQYMG